MFDHRHYVPVLRWKRGECVALRNLPQDVKHRITPLIELVPLNFELKKMARAGGVEARMTQIAREMNKSWGKTPFFLDFHHVHSILSLPGREHPILTFAQLPDAMNLAFVPVMGLGRPHAHHAAVASVVGAGQRPVCIRVFKQDLAQPTFKENLRRLLLSMRVEPSQAHLVVDYQVVDANCPDYGSLCSLLPAISEWKTFAVACGAFPADLTGFEKNRQHLHRRDDWRTWNHEISGSKKLPRLPTFGDYTIQHPIFSEPPAVANVSASIRYTAENEWVIMRGEGLRNPDGPGYRQYPAHAQLLMRRREWCGADFSAGDAQIAQLSLRIDGAGTPESMIRAGVNHHLTFVVRQIERLLG